MTTAAERLREQTEGSRVRTLIVGAGIGGLTLAALLRQRGERLAIIERNPDECNPDGRNLDGNETGYNLALYPLGSRVLHGLGLFERYLEASVPFRYLQVGIGHGEIIHRFDFVEALRRFGPFQGISRADLLEVLRGGLGDTEIHYGTTATEIEQRGAEVRVTFSDGSQAEFDLVVGTDGMHSTTRGMICAQSDIRYWQSGWACWVAWAPAELLPPETAVEYWGAGRLIGIYPVRGQQGVVVAGKAAEMERRRPLEFAGWALEQFGLRGEMRDGVLRAMRAAEPFFWKMQDCRVRRWRQGRVVLLGDAAAGFLPTAGVGASMAMLGAAVLADELSRCDAASSESGLDFYVRRMRGPVEAAQANSRKLARLMFVNHSALAWARDQLVRRYTLQRALTEIVKVMEGRV